MTYVSKREKVFDLPEHDEASSTSLQVSVQDSRLKRFPSVSDRRAWTSEECQRYQHLYGLVNGSESNVSKSSSFKYIPFDVLLAILMAEKDAYIQELLDRQEDHSNGGKLYKAEGFEDSDDDREALIRKDAEVVSLKNKIAGLESELEDYRDTLTKAMHKLENMDSIMNENNLLREKIKYSEETIKFLEEKRAALEKELICYKDPCGAANLDLKRRHQENGDQWDGEDCDVIIRLSSERDILLHQVEELQKQVENAKMVAAEMEVLRKISETTSCSLEEIAKENECYKKKLESMKCLEKHIEELKKQAHTLTDKYKRESQKANDQLKQINTSAKELHILREERSRLEERVNELMVYESQYKCLQSKLHQVELIIDENEALNRNLVELDKLELENQQLRARMEELRSEEIQDKEKIVQLQCALVRQEDEIQNMVRQVQDLNQGYSNKNEIYQMRRELEEKNGRLRKYEKQLTEIPVLENEIDELRFKLQKCIDDFKTDKELLRGLQDELEACRRRCHELEEMNLLCPPAHSSDPTLEKFKRSVLDYRDFGQSFRVKADEKGENTRNIIKQDAGSQIFKLELKEQSVETLNMDCELEKFVELEGQNMSLMNEIGILRTKLSKIDIDGVVSQINDLNNALAMKDENIMALENEVLHLQKKLKGHETVLELKQNLENEVKHLNEMNHLLEKELSLHHKVLEKVQQAEESLRKEKKAREFAVNMVGELEERLWEEEAKMKVEETARKLQKEEANMAKQELYNCFHSEIGNLKDCAKLSQVLINELQTENQILREIKHSETSEKIALKDLINKLQAKVTILKSLSQPEFQFECEVLQEKVIKLLEVTDSLVGEINHLKSALDSEKNFKECLEKELKDLQAEFSACVTAGNEVLSRELEAKEAEVANLHQQILEVRNELENSTNESQVMREENVKLFNNYNILKSQQKALENEVSWLLSRIDELNKTGAEREQQQVLEIASCREIIANYENGSKALEEKVQHGEHLIKVKEDEIQELIKTSTELKNELNKVKQEMEILKSKFWDKKSASLSEVNYLQVLEEKAELEEAMKKIENELKNIKAKLGECEAMEEEMADLKSKRDSLLQKMLALETEVEDLKIKLTDFEAIKTEMEELKAEKSTYQRQAETLNLSLQLQEQQTEFESLKLENENLKEELLKSQNLLDVYKKLEKTITHPSGEFFTPPALPTSPRDLDLVPLETHKQELNDLENEYKVKMENLKEANSVKVKALTVQHEREAKCRSKAFHDSINSIKSSYENDIKKLVEKHKSSIMRLQGLHEDEVQELNTNYETQMEAMQTQNENVINDLRTESAEKCKKLVEDHDRETRELKEKFEELLRERQAKFNEESNSSEGTKSLREAHKQAVDNLTQFYQSSILELEEKHGKEIKKCKKNNLKRIELMKNKYEALLVEERKKYEEQLEELLLQLKKGQEGGGAPTEEEKSHFVQKMVPASHPRLEFAEVLQKIINEGLESLTFVELILVHSKTCFLPSEVENEEGEGRGKPSADGEGGCRHRALMNAEKEELLKRIFTLEHEIVIKQLETHEAIVNMETAEQYRIQELKNALCTAQQKNAELKRLLSSQSKLQMDLKIERYMMDKEASLHETNVVEKVKELERAKADKRRLEEELQKERANAKHLATTLEAEEERFRNQRKRDSEYVESIRLRLEEALNHEQMMESQLDYEARFRTKLESELQALQKSFSLIADLPPDQLTLQSKAAKDIKNMDECETSKEFHSRSKSKHKSKGKSLHGL